LEASIAIKFVDAYAVSVPSSEKFGSHIRTYQLAPTWKKRPFSIALSVPSFIRNTLEADKDNVTPEDDCFRYAKSEEDVCPYNMSPEGINSEAKAKVPMLEKVENVAADLSQNRTSLGTIGVSKSPSEELIEGTVMNDSELPVEVSSCAVTIEVSRYTLIRFVKLDPLENTVS
jgi:hypothetical protein